MSLRLQRLRLWWENAFWVIPLIGIVMAFVLASAVEQVDEQLDEADLRLLAPSSAQTLLSAIGGGMVTFTGFVFSVILLVIQFGSSAYSPRTVTYFMRARPIQWVLASFLGTITFSFLALFSIGSGGRESFVPLLSVLVDIGALVVSLIGFLVLITVVANRIKVDSLLTSIGRMARRQLRHRYAAAGGRAGTPLAARPEPPPEAVLVRYAGRPGQVVGIDVRRLERVVHLRSAQTHLLVRVGDAVSVDSPVARVVHGREPISATELSRCLLVHHERSLKYDPLYALRILTDISLKALSPGINDPTTAVRSLDEVEGVLRVAAGLPLGPAVLDVGEGRIFLRGATWADVVDLALFEIIEAGLTQPQLTRRLTAMVTDLLDDLPADRHDPLLRYQRRLSEEVANAHPLDQDVWLTGDRQGLGGSR